MKYKNELTINNFLLFSGLLKLVFFVFISELFNQLGIFFVEMIAIAKLQRSKHSLNHFLFPKKLAAGLF